MHKLPFLQERLKKTDEQIHQLDNLIEPMENKLRQYKMERRRLVVAKAMDEDRIKHLDRREQRQAHDGLDMRTRSVFQEPEPTP